MIDDMDWALRLLVFFLCIAMLFCAGYGAGSSVYEALKTREQKLLEPLAAARVTLQDRLNPARCAKLSSDGRFLWSGYSCEPYQPAWTHREEK